MNESAFNAEFAEAQRTQSYCFLSDLSISANSALKEVKDYYNV